VKAPPLLLVLALPLVPALPAESRWISLRSPHFELYTDAGPGTGRRLLERFEQIHRVFRGFKPGASGSPLPVRVFLFSSEEGFHRFAIGRTTAGFFQSGPERNYIVMRVSGDQTGRIACHEYVHLVLHHSGARLPRWLEEGAAEFYSTLEAGPTKLFVGRTIPVHLQTLRHGAWLPADVFTSVGQDSPYYSVPGKAGIFYAQSWAFSHMLNLASGYREGTPRFAELLEEGVPVVEGFRIAYGKPIAAALDDLSGYVASGGFPIVELEPPPPEEARISEPVVLSDLAARMARSELLLETGAREAAEREYQRMAGEPSASPEVETALGVLALSRRDHAEARRHLERAIELGGRDAHTFFEYAMLLRDTGGGSEEIVRNLRQAVQVNPKHAEAQFALATMLAAGGAHAEAVEHIEAAAAIQPRKTYLWHALALSYHQLGQQEKALRSARHSLHAADTDQEREMAMAAIRLAGTPRAALAPDRPPVSVPESWQPKRGDSRLEGALEGIDCLGASARFHIRAGGRMVSLLLAEPRELETGNGKPFEFRCGPQKPRPVSVEYNARSDSKLATAGDLVWLAFK